MSEPQIIKKKYGLWILAAIIIIGGYLRILHLNQYSLWEDEFLHVFAAKGILETGTTHLPSGALYDRSILYTYLVALFFKFFGISEISARMPSALLGTLMIPLTYIMASRFINRNAGIIAAFLVAFSPFCIAWSKISRMYALLQPLYLLSVFFFYKAFEKNKNATVKSTAINWLLFLATFYLSFSIHDQVVLFIPTVIVYCAGMFIYVYLQKDFHSALRSKYFKLAIFMIVVGFCVLLFKIFIQKDDVLGFIKRPPVWSEENARNIHFYQWILQDSYPVVCYLYLPALLLFILKKIKSGLFLGSCFLVPFLALSLIFSWKDDRYMFFIFPLFLITSSFLIEYALYYGWRLYYSLTMSHLVGSLFKKRNTIAAFISCLFLFSLLYPILYPWIKIKPLTYMRFGAYDFNKITEAASRIDKNDIVICTQPFLMEFYTQRKPDFMITAFEFADKKTDLPQFTNKDAQPLDHHAGIPLISGLSQLKSLEKSQKRIWIITNAYLFKSQSIDAGIRAYVKENYQKLPLSAKVYEIYYK